MMEIAIDLGTVNVLVYIRGKGIVLDEPSVVAVQKGRKGILAVGAEARSMLGRTPGDIVALRPLRDGVIADFEAAEAMIKYFLGKLVGRSLFFRPRVLASIPSEITPTERRAIREAMVEGGAGKVDLIEEPLAAALGAGLNILTPTGSMVVDIGGGTTDIAVLALGGTVVAKSLRVGGDRFDEAIVRFAKNRHDLLIGERTAEQLKIRLGSADPMNPARTLDVRGRDLRSGLPKTLNIEAGELSEALEEPVREIVDAIKAVLEETPPELAADIVDRGIALTGGGGLLDGLDRRIAAETGVATWVPEAPLQSVVMGAGVAFRYEIREDHLVLHQKVI